MQNDKNMQDRGNKIPVGMTLFFISIVIWLVWYIYAYTPQLSGWSQYKVYEKEMKAEAQRAAVVPTENPYERDEKAIAEGKSIYAASCAACHAENLKGSVGPDLTAHLKYGETDDKKFLSIAKGTQNGMPAFDQQLGRDRIWKVLAYIDSVREYGKKP